MYLWSTSRKELLGHRVDLAACTAEYRPLELSLQQFGLAKQADIVVFLDILLLSTWGESA
jgi:hypothetical protein